MTRIHAIEIDPRTGTAYVQFEPPSPGSAVRQVNVGDSVIFDFGSDGRLVGIEILDPHLTGLLAGKDSSEALRALNVPMRKIGAA